MFLHSFGQSSFHSHRPMLLQATLALSLVVSSLKSVCCDFSISSAVMPRSPALCLTWCGIPSYTIFCNQGPKLWERIHLLQLFILNEYAARMPSLAITLVLSTLLSRLYLRLTWSRRSTNSCSSASEVANRMMSSA